MANLLFREEVVAHQSNRLWGDVLISVPLPAQVLTVLLFSIVVILGLFVSFGSYARMQTVQGYLEPKLGIGHIVATSKGRLIDIYISEDDLVEKGQVVARIASASYLKNGDNTYEVLATDFESLIENIESQIAFEELDGANALEILRSRRIQVLGEKESVAQQLNLTARRIEMLDNQSENAEELVEEGYISLLDLQQITNAQLIAMREMEQLKQASIQIVSELAELDLGIKQFPVQLEQAVARLESRRLEFELRRTEVESRGAYSLKSPVSGHVSGLFVKTGEYVDSNTLLASVLPGNKTLQARLYIPSQAIGFVADGQRVQLSFDSYPYQKFGAYQATIVSVSNTPLIGGDVSGVATALGPVYLATVSLDRQTVRAFGEDHELQPGMSLKADVILGERSLIDWVLEPLYSVRGYATE